MSELEFSRRVALDTIGAGGRDETFEATASECAALARRFGWLSVEALTGTARLTQIAAGVTAVGQLDARIVQPCVATGAPVPETLSDSFYLRFVEVLEGKDEEIELAVDDLDTLSIDHGAVDLGEAAAQTLALAANPYPRCDDAADVNFSTGPANGAFAGLKGLLEP